MDFTTLISIDDTDALDAFVSGCLADGGVWESERTSDGIPSIVRVLEHAADRVRVCAHIYEIDQTLHPFWLELVRTSPTRATWILYFDVLDRSDRRVRNALTSCDRAEDIEWRVILAGEAAVLDGALVLAPGSTRALVRDSIR